MLLVKGRLHDGFLPFLSCIPFLLPLTLLLQVSAESPRELLFVLLALSSLESLTEQLS